MKEFGIYREHVPELITLWRESVEPLWGADRLTDWYSLSMRRVLTYGTLLRRFHIQPEGILYAGAHYGSLLWVWLLLGFKNVLMIEPQEEAIKGLETVARSASALSLLYDRFLGCEDMTQIQLARCAVSDQDGEAELYVMSHSQLTSLQKPNEALIRQPRTNQDISLVEQVKVPIRTLDSLLQEMEAGGSTARYNVLYMNIQGAELKALRGAPKTLETLDFIYLENNFKERYHGNPTAEELTSFLGHFGFEARWGMVQPSVGNGFTAYVRTRGSRLSSDEGELPFHGPPQVYPSEL
jgi:FkbM family methyltransferase